MERHLGRGSTNYLGNTILRLIAGLVAFLMIPASQLRTLFTCWLHNKDIYSTQPLTTNLNYVAALPFKLLWTLDAH